MPSCIHPLHVYDVLTYTTADTSGNFEAQDLHDSMQHFWDVYAAADLKTVRASSRAAYVFGMSGFKHEVATAEHTYTHAMRNVGGNARFINEVDTSQWSTNSWPRSIWFAPDGTMLSTRAARTRCYKKTMLDIFRRLIPFHCLFHNCSWALHGG